MVVSVGEDIEPYEIAGTQPWSDANVIWRWVPQEEFRKLSYHAAVLDRFKVQSDADVVLFADADTMFDNSVDDRKADCLVEMRYRRICPLLPAVES